jgi:UPF0042 nucleotide-binding protein
MKNSLQFVIITGLSGAGKSYAIKCFEDMGYFCVDNLPTTLIPTFAKLCAQSSREIRRIALGIDVREGEYLVALPEILREIEAKDNSVELLFLEAADEALVRRYQESRRRHPLAPEGNLPEGIRAERKMLANLREVADRIIDTSHITVHQLKDLLVKSYEATGAHPAFAVSLISFGYKYGLPYDADLVFDVRFLPNPHFVADLRPLDGRSEAVREFILKHEESRHFIERLKDLLAFLIPFYQREGKAHLAVAIGCTGGRHRSVTLVEELSEFFRAQGFPPAVTHRDVDRE